LSGKHPISSFSMLNNVVLLNIFLVRHYIEKTFLFLVPVMLSKFYSILMVQNHCKESSSNCNRLTWTSKIITADSSCLECCASQEQAMFTVWNVHQTLCFLLRHERCLVTTVFAPGVPRTLPDRMVWHHSWMCVHLLGPSDHLNQGWYPDRKLWCDSIECSCIAHWFVFF